MTTNKLGYKPLTADLVFLDTPQHRSLDAMTVAFKEHCLDGGSDFIGHLFPGQKDRALEAINDAVQNKSTAAAIATIKQELDELFEFAAQAHREALEWEGVE